MARASLAHCHWLMSNYRPFTFAFGSRWFFAGYPCMHASIHPLSIFYFVSLYHMTYLTCIMLDVFFAFCIAVT